ncbi:hypothetical protein RJ639_023001 [Escallonia herrerae]|uniref:AAA+ ATPase At3g28540-like C-terminal domain-containing protein n=1 Tax=Escallonia herrerae TaxID=1293975 RepID=A0AA89AE37_9ASTE|nr:hypothetical protein RJ639_023001 [Escallonia herrerae]
MTLRSKSHEACYQFLMVPKGIKGWSYQLLEYRLTITMAIKGYQGVKGTVNYLDVGVHHVFDKIRELLEEVDMTPADVEENSMPKSAEDDADACLGNLIRALEMAKEERWKGGRRRRGIGAMRSLKCCWVRSLM